MKTLTFSIDISAPKEKVWYSLWDDENYENWTTAFSEGSFAVSDWNEGSKIYFCDPNGNGMNSKIVTKKPFDTMTFKHFGELKDFTELPETEITKTWSGSEERYDLTENNGVTTVTVHVDIVESHLDYFNDAFPKALEILKNIAESETKTITVKTTLDASLEDVWNKFTQPEHIVNWNFASDDWHCPKAENHLEVGQNFVYTMASKDGEMTFDFVGTYQKVIPMKKLVYTIADGRKVTVKFDVIDSKVILTENFEPENIHSVALQREGWQSILNNFKKYTNQ
ncbi:SRPBCC domain-containing protein [Flavobacterium sp.]|uniref:SRPBCC domain-containing protein n=1 Tax=Flavobacterium sp. TaxID=239 RepID=UPI0039198562